MLMPPSALTGHRRVRWVATQAVLVAAGVFCYFQVRGLTAAAPRVAFAHARDVLSFEQRLGIDVEPGLQAVVTVSPVLETLANWVYIWGHWPVIVGVMAWLAWHHRHVFLRLRDAMLISGSLGLVVFVSYPVAPPRLADTGLVDTVTEHSRAYRFLQPPNFVNQYAAMPSLHAGWDLLVGLSVAAAATTVAVRLLGYLLPVLMAFSVVATANHYVVDVAAGLALALVGYAGALLLERRRERRSREEVP
ncbi:MULTISPECIES: phosphatase PAP2 family protein [unclassified Nocardioides]|uniref:phosphatase PAP2 family protein n=1 Tax=unclassified Nocardioides TaxID=2615069 RepID=UPI0009F12BDB|nr:MULTISPECIES: phosphatase PAP2 family protein [unclassified Nocardioides]GAW48242.1 PA-phosphatase-like phosphoesterase [Nocardioides sp. PD653-B2]GAW57448.1 PA-phosphatase-like phosphoesterase [Nocardioides sp. PD653]